MWVVFVFPPRNTFNTLRTSHLSRTFRPQIHPFTYTPPPPTPASPTRASSMVVFCRSACDRATPSHQLNQPLNIVCTSSPHQYKGTHRQAPVVSDSTFASPLLSSLNGADLPFLRMRYKAVLTIWSKFSEYEFDMILSAPQARWGEFTGTLGFGRGNIEEKSGERLGYRGCPSLNPCSSTATLLSPH